MLYTCNSKYQSITNTYRTSPLPVLLQIIQCVPVACRTFLQKEKPNHMPSSHRCTHINFSHHSGKPTFPTLYAYHQHTLIRHQTHLSQICIPHSSSVSATPRLPPNRPCPLFLTRWQTEIPHSRSIRIVRLSFAFCFLVTVQYSFARIEITSCSRRRHAPFVAFVFSLTTTAAAASVSKRPSASHGWCTVHSQEFLVGALLING